MNISPTHEHNELYTVFLAAIPARQTRESFQEPMACHKCRQSLEEERELSCPESFVNVGVSRLSMADASLSANQPELSPVPVSSVNARDMDNFSSFV